MTSSLSDMQSAFAAAIRHGPDHVQFGDFEGDQHRIKMGFAVYANTISHGRLVALEQTFPQTLEFLGDETFNTLSRNFVEAGGGSHAPLSELGEQFPHWLEQQGQVQGAQFARFEWNWLESYRAEEAEPLTREDLAQLDENRLLSMVIARHPAARLVEAEEAICRAIGLPESTSKILIARPNADVLVHSSSAESTSCIETLTVSKTVAEVLEKLSEDFDEEAILPAVLHLVDAGALAQA